ncbi:MAG: hypothetical protein C0404_03825 [Verrucomicrobia bacterium]|nr:hypothetical protein [Verrucomicrobiota bacterium]
MKQENSATIKVAVLDDDRTVCDLISRYLKRDQQFVVGLYSSPHECLEAIGKDPVDIVITDLLMPEMDGISVLKRVKELNPATDVIIITGEADKKAAIQALKQGAYDFFEKPVQADELLETIRRTVRFQGIVRERNKFADQVSYLSKREAHRWGIEGFIGKSPAVKGIVQNVKLLQQARDIAVLIIGESGTGKELVARAIHYGGQRAGRPFVPVNCSAIPSELAESILFGHVRGSFTGATGDKKGCFELADGGTLFLDEIGDMPAALQTKLLRVLEDGMIMPVGGSKEKSVDVRVVAATNADLQARLAAGSFRTDLFYRLSGFKVTIPPLRERTEDIPLLVEHFVSLLSEEMGAHVPEIGEDAMGILKRHAFPGNVRELRNIIERALIESGGKALNARHLHIADVPVRTGGDAAPVSPADMPLNMRQAEMYLVRKAMEQSGDNISAAAKLLGINRTKLYRKLSMVEK